jgi:hypothetical protein
MSGKGNDKEGEQQKWYTNDHTRSNEKVIKTIWTDETINGDHDQSDQLTSASNPCIMSTPTSAASSMTTGLSLNVTSSGALKSEEEPEWVCKGRPLLKVCLHGSLKTGDEMEIEGVFYGISWCSVFPGEMIAYT